MNFIYMLAIMLAISYVLDIHSVYVRTHDSAEMVGEFLALANLVQYLSRIMVVVTVFFISVLTETGHESINFIATFFIASIIAVISGILILKNEKIANLICLFVRPLIFLSFKNISNQKYWKVIKRPQEKMLLISSFCVNMLALCASLLPFIIAEYVPQYRMTSVYAGQLLNFGATAIVLTMQDPKAMRLLSSGSSKEARSSILFGRLASHLVISFILGFFVF